MPDLFGEFCSPPKSEEWIRRYRAGGWRTGLEPNAWFSSRWYRWQNPQSASEISPFDHYVATGCREGRDPSPMVDFHQLLATHGAAAHNGEVYRDLVAHGASVSQGAYRSFDDLRTVQDEALQQMRPLVLGNHLQAHRRFLVVVQNHASPRLTSWTRDRDRTFDLWVNYYSSQAVDPEVGDISTFQVGTKFTAMLKLLEGFATLLEPYDYVLWLDDDIEVEVSALNAAFAEAEQLAAGLAQLRLTPDSHCVWPVLKSTGTAPLRLNTVEIMMPILSRRILSQSAPFLRQCISGFGLDLAWGALSERLEAPAFLLTATARHPKPIDQTGGAYYNFLRSFHLNAKTELWCAMGRHGVMPTIRDYYAPANDNESLALAAAIEAFAKTS